MCIYTAEQVIRGIGLIGNFWIEWPVACKCGKRITITITDKIEKYVRESSSSMLTDAVSVLFKEERYCCKNTMLNVTIRDLNRRMDDRDRTTLVTDTDYSNDNDDEIDAFSDWLEGSFTNPFEQKNTSERKTYDCIYGDVYIDPSLKFDIEWSDDIRTAYQARV